MDSNSHSTAAETIPSELMGQRPRRVSLALNCLLRVTISWALVALGAASAVSPGLDAKRQAQHRAALRAGGSEVAAAITSLGREGRAATRNVRYSFSANGRAFTGNAAVPDPLYFSLQTVNSLPIVYLPADPTVNHPAAWEWSAGLVLSPMLGPILFVGAGMISLLLVRRQRRYIVQGLPVLAEVTACSLGSGRADWYTVTYQFRAEDGRVAGGSVRSESAQDVGATICVLYLPRNPKRNVVYRSTYYRVAE